MTKWHFNAKFYCCVSEEKLMPVALLSTAKQISVKEFIVLITASFILYV